MKVQLKRLTLDFACCYILSIHFSAKLAGSKNCVLQTPDFFLSSRLRKTLQQIELEELHFISVPFEPRHTSFPWNLFWYYNLFWQSTRLISCVETAAEKNQCKVKSHEMPVIGWWHFYFSVASELNNNQCNRTTSCFQIFSFPYSDLHF